MKKIVLSPSVNDYPEVTLCFPPRPVAVKDMSFPYIDFNDGTMWTILSHEMPNDEGFDGSLNVIEYYDNGRTNCCTVDWDELEDELGARVAKEVLRLLETEER